MTQTPGNHLGFGLALPMVGTGISTQSLLAELAVEVRAAETHGFELCLLPEHHGGPDAALSDPMTLVAWLLAQTATIRVGTGVLLLPLHSIPRLAEQGSVLQHASGGRLVLGVGAGYQAADFATFGVERSSRGEAMSAGIAGLKQAWGTGSLNGQPIRPLLDGQPAPPLYVGAWSGPGLRRAAAEADGWIADPIRSVAETEQSAQAYREIAQTAGRNEHVIVMREGWVGETDAAAAATFAPVIEPIYRYYLRHGAFPAGHGLAPDDLKLQGTLADRVLCGSSASVTDRVVDLIRRTHAQTVVFGLRHPHGPGHHEVLIAIERLGREVLPAVRSRLLIDREVVPQ